MFTWFKMNRSWDHQTGMLDLSNLAMLLWIRAYTYVIRYSTDGFVEDKALCECLKGRNQFRYAQELCDAGFWEQTDGGYTIVGFVDENGTNEAVHAKREQAALRMKKLRAKRKALQSDSMVVTAERNAGGLETGCEVDSGARTDGEANQMSHEFTTSPVSTSAQPGQVGSKLGSTLDQVGSKLGSTLDQVGSKLGSTLDQVCNSDSESQNFELPAKALESTDQADSPRMMFARTGEHVRVLDQRDQIDQIPPLTPPPGVESGEGKKTRSKSREGSKGIPDDWKPKPTHFEIGRERDLDADAVREAALDFADYNRQKGNVNCDWDSAFNRWLRHPLRSAAAWRGPDGRQKAKATEPPPMPRIEPLPKQTLEELRLSYETGSRLLKEMLQKTKASGG